MRKIVLIGDSITQFSSNPSLLGFGASLQNTFGRYFDILNRGYSGYNTNFINCILDEILNEFEDVAVCTLFLGANDAVLPEYGGQHQHVPLSKYKDNLISMGKRILIKSKLILITPPPVDDRRGDERKFMITKQYRDACLEVAKQLDCPVIDLFEVFGMSVNAHPEFLDRYLVDGLHLNANGNEAVYENIYNTLIGWEEFNLDKIQMVYPPWREFEINAYLN